MNARRRAVNRWRPHPMLPNHTALRSPAALLAFFAVGCGGVEPPAPMTEHLEPITIVAADPIQAEAFNCESAFLIEASSGTVLYEQNADEPRAPASMAKMMLELVVMDLVADGELSLDEQVEASAWASKMGGSQVYLKEGEVFTVGELMEAIAIASANDACVAIAEYVAGHVDAFVDMMNRRAVELGLENTQYVNVHGLDDDPKRLNWTTAREIATIGQHLIDHEPVRVWSSTPRAPFRNGTFQLENTNLLVGKYRGLDGIKTGYTERAEYNLCASAERGGLRFISVVMGAKTREECADMSASLLSRAFAAIDVVEATVDGEPVSPEAVAVEQGASDTIMPVARRNVRVLVPARDGRELTVRLVLDEPLLAPLSEGSPIGSASVAFGDTQVASVPLVSDRDVEAKGFKAWLRGVVG